MSQTTTEGRFAPGTAPGDATGTAPGTATGTATGADSAPGAADTVPSGWEGLLDPGETILWQGRPDQRFHLSFDKLPIAVFGLFFTGFALFWMLGAAMGGGNFWMFGLIHFSVGAYMTGNALAGEALRHRATWYTLTDRRAFIATRTLTKGRQLQSFPIDKDTVFDYRAGPLATIYFNQQTRRGNKGSSYTVDIGFERIAEGDSVLALMRQIQTAAPREAHQKDTSS